MQPPVDKLYSGLYSLQPVFILILPHRDTKQKTDEMIKEIKMILAEKIMSLRKQNGWSQEELAEQLDVSRQSVSKWESGTSIPDIEKIIKMSQIFYVSTDYLLKDKDDDIEEVRTTAVVVPAEDVDSDSQENARPISMEFAAEFIEFTKTVSKRFGAAVSLCVLSPIAVMILGAMSEEPKYNVSKGLVVGIGVTLLLIMVAAAVMIFIMDGMKLSKYEFLEKEPIKLMYGVEAVVARNKEMYEPTFRLCIAMGVILCILSSIPVAIAGAIGASEVMIVAMAGVLLALVSVAVFLFVSSGMVYGSFQKLLQLDDYDPEEKRNKKRYDKIFGAYWCVITAGYLAWSFITMRWDFTWIVWPVAGVCFVPFKMLVELIGNKNQ